MMNTLYKTLAGIVVTGCLWSASVQAQVPAAGIKADGMLKVAIYNDFAPFSNNANGIDADLAAALAVKLGLKLSLLPFPAGDDVDEDLRNMVWKGHYLGYGPADVMLHVPVESVLQAHNDKVTIFAPYYREAVRLVVDTRKVPNYESINSLEGKKIGVEKVSIGAVLMLGAEDGKFRDDVKILPSATEALEKLKAGELDGVVANRSEIDSVLGKDANFQMNEIAFQRLPVKGWLVGMAVKKDNAVLIKALQDATNELIASGQMRQIFAQHGVLLVLP